MSVYPRTNYEMSKEDLETILDACKPVTCMMIGGVMPRSPQENANAAWASLGKKMGFDSTTVMPILGESTRHFTAVPSETEKEKHDRLHEEAREKRVSRIATLESEIKQKQEEIGDILEETDE